MCHFSTLRKVFSTKKKKKSDGTNDDDAHDNHSDHPQKGLERDNNNTPQQDEESSGLDDPNAALTEVSSPEPVQDRGDGRLSRRRSLEDQYEANKENARHHQDGEDTDPFGNLSEVASPEPVQDRDEDGTLSRHASLEDRLEGLRRRESRSSTSR
ncbi:hypothetical protein DTO207G8_3765 [Paecilomyces variotii]|nr:hypothetical protein DTO207G8_3765 [Paecilomyces variotii]KAJ9355961.1 hypothetical protein DTO027B9_3803 [Paecilomyces variotii]